MAKDTVIVGCKLPNGIILQHPLNAAHKVEIAGLNKPKIIGAPYVTTEVDAEFWANWVAVHSEFPALKSGALFAVKSAKDIDVVASEHAKRKTGLEKMKPTDGGVKPADKE